MSLRPLAELAPPLTGEQRARYARQTMLASLGEEGQRRLLGSRVLVIGAGGLGSPTILYLAGAGVGTIGIVDDDAVEPDNLHRQIVHDATATGIPKVASAAARAKALNPDVAVAEHDLRLTEGNATDLISGYDLVIDGSDNFMTRYVVDAACSQLSIPEVWGSILRFSAQVSVFWTGSRAIEAGVPEPGVCLRDLFPSPPPPGTTPSCGEAGVLGTLCGQAGCIMAGETIKLLTGIGEPLLGRVLVMDALKANSQQIPLAGTAARPAPLTGRALSEACAPRPKVAEIDVATLRDLRAAGPVTILDVREARERQTCAIDGSTHVPLADVLADPRRVAADLGPGPVYVHCLKGSRSLRAAEALADVGVEAVNVAGGIHAWWSQVDPNMPRY